jgi:hypothetical protein
MASLSGDAKLRSDLEIALTRQKHKALNPDNPVELLHEALKNLIAQGYAKISTTHLMLEMRSMTHRDLGKSFTTEIPEWSRPDWVGRMLRTHDLIEQDPATHERRRLFGAHLRCYPIRRAIIDEVKVAYVNDVPPVIIEVGTHEPTDFCQGCSGCPYMSLGCEIMDRRLQAEGGEVDDVRWSTPGRRY